MPPRAAPAGPRVTAPMVVSVGLLALAFAALFRDVLYKQYQMSVGNPADWGHSFLVPAITGYLIYQRREALRATGRGVFWPGIMVVLLGVLSYVFGVGGYSNHMIQGWAAVLTLFGMVLLLLGPGVAAVVLFPIGYLACGVTVSDQVMIRLTAPLQRIASEGAYLLLQVFGMTVDLSGTIITIYTDKGEPIPLNIAEACSGLRMVIAFIALGAAVALVACRYWWQRVVLLALSVPVALFINVIRVVVLAVASLYNPELSRGEAHMFIGTFLLIPGFLLFMLVLWVLNRMVTEAEGAGAPRPAPGAGWADGWPRLTSPALVACLVILGGSAVGFNAAIAALKINLQKSPIYAAGNRQTRAIPAETQTWVRVGDDLVEGAAVQEELGTLNYVSRVYARKPGAPPLPRLDLHLAYYTGMIDTVPHVPERCFVGGGMLITGDPVEVPLPLDQTDWIPHSDAPPELAGLAFRAKLSGDPAFTDSPNSRVTMPLAPAPVPAERGADRTKVPIAMRITRFVEPRSGRTLFAGYFFIANGSTVASANGVRLLAFDLTADYAYYLKVQVSSAEVKSAEELAAAAAGLLDELLPEIMRCVPDWVEVRSGRYPPDNPRGAATNPAAPSPRT